MALTATSSIPFTTLEFVSGCELNNQILDLECELWPVQNFKLAVSADSIGDSTELYVQDLCNMYSPCPL